jgi:hypothetical protein
MQVRDACTHRLRRRGSSMGGRAGQKSSTNPPTLPPMSGERSTPHSQHNALAHHQRVVVGSTRALLVTAQEGEKQQPGAAACACLCAPAKRGPTPTAATTTTPSHH